MELLIAEIIACAVAGIMVVAALVAIFRRANKPVNAVDRKTKSKNEEHHHRSLPDVKETEKSRSAGGEEDNEKITDFSARQEETITYVEGSTKNNELRHRRGESHYVHSSPPPYTAVSSQPPAYNEDGYWTPRQSSPKVFYEDPGKTIPKREVSVSEQIIDDHSNNYNGASIEESSTLSFQGTEEELQNGVRQEIELPIIKAESPVDSFPFEVDKNGCRIETPYCKLHFPPGATKRPIHIKMRPDYNYVIKENRIQICPTVSFSSEDELVFDKKVTIAIHTSYTAIPDETIEVQVIRRKNSGDSPFEVYKEKLLHGADHYIEFTVEHFCSYTAEADESQFRNMQKNYYSAVYMKKPKSDTIRYLNWLIYDNCPQIIWERMKYFKSKDMTVDPEIISIRHNHNLQLSFAGRDVNIPKPECRSPFSEKWGSRVNESFQFKITRDATNQDPDSEMMYKITARHVRTQDLKLVLEKHLFLEWQREEIVPSTVFNVSGNRAAGIVTNRRVETQFSNISDASSGIVADGSNLLSIDSRVEDLGSSCESAVEEESAAEEDDRLSAPDTTPKCDVDSLLDSQPKSQSTPQSGRNNIRSKEKVESMGSSEKSFTS